MRTVEAAFEQVTARVRDQIQRILDSRHVSARVTFLEATRHHTLTVFEHLRRWWP